MIEYKKFAKYYDLLYSGLDYKKGVKGVFDLYKKYNKSGGRKLLDVACGTGEHIKYFSSKFDCTGLDLNREMLKIARKKCPKSIFVAGDMNSFKMKDRFDVITCLFNSMNHLSNLSILEKTFNNLYQHLKIGGVLIIEMFTDKNYFIKNNHHLRFYDGDDIKIARIGSFVFKNGKSNMVMEYLISEKGKNIVRAKEKVYLSVFSKEKTFGALKKAGFKTKFIKHGFYGNGLFVGIKS